MSGRLTTLDRAAASQGIRSRVCTASTLYGSIPLSTSSPLPESRRALHRTKSYWFCGKERAYPHAIRGFPRTVVASPRIGIPYNSARRPLQSITPEFRAVPQPLAQNPVHQLFGWRCGVFYEVATTPRGVEQTGFALALMKRALPASRPCQLHENSDSSCDRDNPPAADGCAAPPMALARWPGRTDSQKCR
jgi:hypothetical protein